jgi:hypothetical protein
VLQAFIGSSRDLELPPAVLSLYGKRPMNSTYDTIDHERRGSDSDARHTSRSPLIELRTGVQLNAHDTAS